MTESKDIVKKGQELDTSCEDPELTPVVDICRSGEEIRLIVDLPGVDEKSVQVSLEDDVLSVRGQVCRDVPEGYRPVMAGRCGGTFSRSFDVSERIDPAGITARMKDGVLTLALPVREGLKRRKIEIQAAA